MSGAIEGPFAGSDGKSPYTVGRFVVRGLPIPVSRVDRQIKYLACPTTTELTDLVYESADSSTAWF